MPAPDHTSPPSALTGTDRARPTPLNGIEPERVPHRALPAIHSALSTTATLVGLLAVILLIVGLVVAFLQHRFVLRLVANIAIVAVFAITYVALRK